MTKFLGTEFLAAFLALGLLVSAGVSVASAAPVAANQQNSMAGGNG